MKSQGIVWSYTKLGDAVNIRDANVHCVVAVVVATRSILVLGQFDLTLEPEPAIGMVVECDGDAFHIGAEGAADVRVWRRVSEQ